MFRVLRSVNRFAFGKHALVQAPCLADSDRAAASAKVSFLGGRVPLDLRFRGPLEAKSFVRGRKIDPPGAP